MVWLVVAEQLEASRASISLKQEFLEPEIIYGR
jgi:hypothetical protein